MKDAETVALMPVPNAADLAADVVRRSACSARRYFAAVVVAFCESDATKDAKLDLLDATADGRFEAGSLADGIFV